MRPLILVVEDDVDNRAFVTVVLKKANFEVLVASNGLEAIEIATREHPDLIFMDLSMPKMDGWHATAQLRKEEKTASIPIVALTAHALMGDELEALEAGCTDYLAKPCVPKDIVSLARKILEFKIKGAHVENIGC